MLNLILNHDYPIFSWNYLYLLIWSILLQIVHIYEVKWNEAAQLCPTFCNPMDCSLRGFSIHGIFQARVLEWVAYMNIQSKLAIIIFGCWNIGRCSSFFLSFSVFFLNQMRIIFFFFPITLKALFLKFKNSMQVLWGIHFGATETDIDNYFLTFSDEWSLSQ